MRWRFSHGSDVQVRLVGLALVLLSALLLTWLPAAHAAARISPSTTEFGIAFAAVLCGSIGACLLFVGRALFDPVPDRRDRARPVPPAARRTRISKK